MKKPLASGMKIALKLTQKAGSIIDGGLNNPISRVLAPHVLPLLELNIYR